MILYISSFILCLLFRYIKQTQSSVKFFISIAAFYVCFYVLATCAALIGEDMK